VDDERQIHASLRLRIGEEYDVTYCLNAQTALEKVQQERFDLCFADIHMPKMDGIAFIEAAQRIDPALGYVVLSAFDSNDNLRRTIPLQVYEFISKPLPGRADFEAKLPYWIDRTRRRRREDELAQQAGGLASNLDSARLEREVELIASETARDALLQTANLLTTIQAHLLTATGQLAARARTDAHASHLLRSLEEARKTSDAAMTVAETFFGSAYGNRESSPALLSSGVRHAAGIASRILDSARSNKLVDFSTLEDRLPLRGLSGIDFLLMLVPLIGGGLVLTGPSTTVGVKTEQLPRLDAALKLPRLKNGLWLNRKNAILSHPAVLITILADAPALNRTQAEAWLKGEHAPFASLPARRIFNGIQKCQGLFAIALAPEAKQFRVALVLPT